MQPDVILVDGNKSFNYDAEVIPIVKGDAKSQSIASASIIAKVIRDRIMIKLAKKYPKLWLGIQIKAIQQKNTLKLF